MPSVPSIAARDFMTTKVISVTPETDLMAAMRVFLAHRISGTPVIDQHGALVGMLTERDCLQSVVAAGYHGECSSGSVAAFMTPDVVSVDVADGLLDIAHLFITAAYRRFPVLDQGRVVGVISRRDVIQAVIELA